MEDDVLIEKTIKYFSKLPGFGPRAARRLVLYFLKNKDTVIGGFVEVLKLIEEKIKFCPKCHNITASNVCDICSNDKRNKTSLCIVSEVDDLWNFEKLNIFNGVYHCLGGSLSAISGITPEKLNIQSLLARLQKDVFEEIIFANNLSVEGATTTFYILEEIYNMQKAGLIGSNIKITELANGIPIGSSLEYMDEKTIKIAFDYRKDIVR